MKIYPCSITGYWSCEEFFLSFFPSLFWNTVTPLIIFSLLFFGQISFLHVSFYTIRNWDTVTRQNSESLRVSFHEINLAIFDVTICFFSFFFSFSLFEARNTLCLGVFTVYVGLRKLLLCVTCFISLDLFHDIETDVVSKEIRTASLLKIK